MDSSNTCDRTLSALLPLKELYFEPTLAHGNLTLSNIIVEPNGRAHIIDWGSCQGHMAQDLDLAELLVFNTPATHLQSYLRGHDLPENYIQKNSDLLLRLQLVRQFLTAHWLCEIDSPRTNDLASYVRGVRSLLAQLNHGTHQVQV